MADEAQETVAPALDQSTESESVVIDTLDTTESTSQPGSEAHEEEKTTTPEEDTQPKVEPEKEEAKPEAHVESEEVKRSRIKMSQLEKGKVEAERRIRNIEAFLSKKPDVYKEALMETAGYSEEEADALVKSLQQQVKSELQTAQPSQAVQPMDVMEAVRQAMQKEKEAEVRASEVKTFISRHPEMDPKNLNPNEMPLMKAVATGIEERASQMIQEAGLEGKVVSRLEALDSAYAEYKTLSSREIAKAREQGEIEGMAKSNAINSAVVRTGNYSGQTTSSPTQLTELEQQMARAAGMSDESYNEWKNKEAVIS